MEDKHTKPIKRWRLIALLFSLIVPLLLCSSCNNLNIKTSLSYYPLLNVQDGFVKTSYSSGYLVGVEIGTNSKTDLDSLYDVNLRIKKQVFSALNVRVYDGAIIYVNVPIEGIIDVLEEIDSITTAKQDKATEAYNAFEDKCAYELGRQLLNGTLPNYGEIQRSAEKERKLYDAMQNPEIDYRQICGKYISISIVKSEKNTERTLTR